MDRINYTSSGYNNRGVRMPTATELAHQDPNRNPIGRARVISFSYDHGIPEGADLVYDTRHLTDQDNNLRLRNLTGLDEQVHAAVMYGGTGNPHLLLRDADDASLAAVRHHGEVTVAVGSRLGRHRAVAVAEHIAKHLWTHRVDVTVEHRHIDSPYPRSQSLEQARKWVLDELIDIYGDDTPADYDDGADDSTTIVDGWVIHGCLPREIAEELIEDAYEAGVPGVAEVLSHLL